MVFLANMAISQGKARSNENRRTVEKADQYPKRRTTDCEGWTVHIAEELDQNAPDSLAKALELLALRLQEITRVVPGDAVLELKKVPLWFSEQYPNAQASSRVPSRCRVAQIERPRSSHGPVCRIYRYPQLRS
jgi:hypothetical protein